MAANEALSQNATVQELAELALHKAGHVAIAFTLSIEEGFQMFGDNTLKRTFLWISGPVGVDRHEGIGECNWTGNPHHSRLSNLGPGRHRRVRL